MSILKLLLDLFVGLMGLGKKAAEAAERKEQRDIGRVLQHADDLEAQNEALQRMREATANAPQNQKELDEKLDKGEV